MPQLEISPEHPWRYHAFGTLRTGLLVKGETPEDDEFEYVIRFDRKEVVSGTCRFRMRRPFLVRSGAVGGSERKNNRAIVFFRHPGVREECVIFVWCRSTVFRIHPTVVAF